MVPGLKDDCTTADFIHDERTVRVFVVFLYFKTVTVALHAFDLFQKARDRNDPQAVSASSLLAARGGIATPPILGLGNFCTGDSLPPRVVLRKAAV